MKDLPLFAQPASEPEPAPSAPKALTVSQLTAKIRGTLEPAFAQVWVQGEVSNYRPAASGHAYFSLKDDAAMIGAAIFGWGARNKKNPKTAFDLRDGLQVMCRGKLSVYPPRGGYQLIIDQIEPLGAGALQVAFEQLKARLLAEGLFDPKRKRPLPKFPQRIAVVTSPSGAAIRDMLNILARRAPNVGVVIVPALVQGEEASKQILRGLETANNLELGDIVVLARGGGSIEDLWCFNDEELARGIARSKLPVISAVGHEIDFTISDFVADLRAPTPSAAAELVSGHWVDCRRQLKESAERLKAAMFRDLTTRKTLLGHVAARVVSPRDRLREQMQRIDDLYLRLERGVRVRLDTRRSALDRLVAKLDALSPLKVLERGYSIIRAIDGEKVVRSAAQIKAGEEFRVTFYDGDAKVRAL
jgi:exodeoxyribonuclease VII large subunit